VIHLRFAKHMHGRQYYPFATLEDIGLVFRNCATYATFDFLDFILSFVSCPEMFTKLFSAPEID